MLDWWDRVCTNLSDRFNISKSSVGILLALLVVKLVAIVILVAVLLCWNSEKSENSEPSSPNGSNDELILAHTVCSKDGKIQEKTICRHGARNPAYVFPNDPCGSIKENWPEGLGEMTNLGKQQHFELGQYLRKRYAKLLGNGDFLASNVYVRSTDVNRCLMSAQSCMAGLFPPQGNQVWNEALNWQPVPIHTVPKSQDHLILPWLGCERFQNAWNELTNSTEFKSIIKKYKSLINYLEEKSGDKLSTLHDLHLLYDRLLVGRSKDKCTPSFVENVMQSGGDFEQIDKFYFTSQTDTTEMKKLRSGFLLKEILDQSRNIQGFQKIEPPKLRLYFAHDITIVDLLSSLGLFTFGLPEFTSCLFFELYKNKTDYYFQVFYRNTTTALNVPALELPNTKCKAKCPLNQWYAVYKDILPTKTIEMECTT